ncbi:MAG: AAA family ATPase [Candidatus Kuenenia sp.]|nr:AAA family ATPase [Candidatus Kuenenia hertensis]
MSELNLSDPHLGLKETSFSLLKALILGAELQELNIRVDWLVEGLIPKDAITLFSARGGMGKTILSITLADAVSKGILFLGLKTSKTPVVYIDFENSLAVLSERVKRVDAHDVLFWHSTNEIKPPRLDSADFKLYKQLPAGALLIFDTLRAAQSKDENDSQHMAFVMQRLKELRDSGFTILVLHHTRKSNDRTYKGSSAIYDLSDHTLNLYRVKRSTCTSGEGEDIDTDDDDDSYYRFCTADKTRYEPFSIFLEFDPEIKNFKIAPDPETEILEEIHSLLIGKELLKTNEIFELIKKEMGIKGKAKFTRLLKKGIGKFWTSIRASGNKTIRYRPINHQSVSPVPISEDQRTNGNSLVRTNETSGCSGNPETLVDTDRSVSLGVEKTNETNGNSLVRTVRTNAGVTETGQDAENIPETSLEAEEKGYIFEGVI